MRREAKNELRTDDPLPWLLTLEMSRQRGDFERAAPAKKELAKLGIRVSYGRRRELQKAVSNAR